MLVFTDSETRSLADVTVCGAHAYARHPSTEGIVWGWCADDAPFKVWSPPWCWGNVDGITPDEDHPEELLTYAEEGAYLVAWNASFDFQIWNEVMVPKYGWPKTELEQWLCAQALAEANNLPGKLDKAAETLGTKHQKDPKGKQLIAQLSNGSIDDWNPEAYETIEKMGHFRNYCGKDCMSMRDVWNSCRPLTQQEWHQYHVSERINQRGIGVDVEFARAAMTYARAESDDINSQLAELTNDPLMTVTNHQRKAIWLHDNLCPSEEVQELTQRPEKKGKKRFSADRPTREAVGDMLAIPGYAAMFSQQELNRILDFIELIEAGNSAAVRKYAAIVNTEYNGRVYGQYSFNGAGQTGRFSSRGIQIHNLIRAALDSDDADKALDAMDDILAGVSPEVLVEEYGLRVSRLLARLLRPTFIADEDKMFVWADWAQIEARVLPWLADTRASKEKLRLFEKGVDNYKTAAIGIFHLGDIDDVDKDQRQVGKVAELALGFGGATGAFNSMARNYGVVLPEEQVNRIVQGWRAANGWCVDYWYRLWEAAQAAYAQPGNIFTAGRVRYVFAENLMKGSLVCVLPCGRWIVYPQFRSQWEEWEEEDPDTGETIERAGYRTSFVKGYGGGGVRINLWYGILAENVTQGTAASFLRHALDELDAMDCPVVLHTHDEILTEVTAADRGKAVKCLKKAMTTLPDWADGLPLEIDIEEGPYYTK